MNIIKNDGSSIELIRFFEYQGKNFLIFGNGEGADANGHVTIHICNVDMTNGAVATAVQESDMDVVRNTIKLIVSENRNGALSSIKDLDYNNLNGVVIFSDWPLKMMPNYIDIIKMNQPTFVAEKNDVANNNDFSPFNILSNDVPKLNDDFVTPDLSVTSENQSLMSDINGLNQFENMQYNENLLNNSFDNSNQNELNNNNQNNGIDYEKMYFEQLNINNNLNTELQTYKNKFEQLKNIISN